MPFVALEPEAKVPTASLKYLRAAPRGKHAASENAREKAKQQKPRLLLTLPTNIFVAKSKGFTLAIGTGKDVGRLRVIGAKSGGTAPVVFKTHIMLRFGHLPKLGEDMFDERATVTRIDDETYELMVPFLGAPDAP